MYIDIFYKKFYRKFISIKRGSYVKRKSSYCSGFIKSIDHQPTGHRPLTDQSTNPLTTNTITIFKGLEIYSLYKTQKQLWKCKTLLLSIVYKILYLLASITKYTKELITVTWNFTGLLLLRYFIVENTRKFLLDEMFFFQLTATLCIRFNLPN